MNRREFLKTGVNAAVVCAGGMLCCGCTRTGIFKSGDSFKLTKKQLPAKVTVDASSLCQLNCPRCNMRMFPDNIVGAGYLKFKDFKKFIDKNSEIKEVELSNYGEIFLNPELPQIIQYAHEKNISLNAVTGVNLNTISEEMLEALVKYKFDKMVVSLDGASQETYAKYRVGGNFDRVIGSIRKLNYYKAKYNSDFPHLMWKFIIFGHNEHEIPKAKIMAKKLNIPLVFELSWDNAGGDWAFSPVKNLARAEKEIAASAASDFRLREGDDVSAVPKHLQYTICEQLWTNPRINWDGKVLGCCYNYQSAFGENVFDKSLTEIINLPGMVYARKMLAGNAPERKDIPCTKCWAYNDMKEITGSPPCKRFA